MSGALRRVAMRRSTEGAKAGVHERKVKHGPEGALAEPYLDTAFNTCFMNGWYSRHEDSRFQEPAARVHALLKKIEWGGEGADLDEACPGCGMFMRNGHRGEPLAAGDVACPLAALLEETKPA